MTMTPKEHEWTEEQLRRYGELAIQLEREGMSPDEAGRWAFEAMQREWHIEARRVVLKVVAVLFLLAMASKWLI
jgi:hypothetical protein